MPRLSVFIACSLDGYIAALRLTSVQSWASGFVNLSSVRAERGD